MILILGKDGQLGRALEKALGGRAVAFGRDEADLRDADFVSRLEAPAFKYPLQAVINAAAYTQVDRAESEDKSEAFRVNAEAPGELAAWCAAKNLPLVHYSTDYVFDGSGDRPWRETDAPRPINAYGESKLAGERAVAAAGGRHLIFRTSWVYDARGENFFTTMLRLFGEKESLKIVSDQFGAPTYAPHLAAATQAALGKAFALPEFPSGIYHLCGAGETSWHGFAQAIFALATSADSGEKSWVTCQRIDPIPSSGYPLPARRPLNSRLDCARARDRLGVSLPHWQAGLKECFAEKYGNSKLRDTGPQARPA